MSPVGQDLAAEAVPWGVTEDHTALLRDFSEGESLEVRRWALALIRQIYRFTPRLSSEFPAALAGAAPAGLRRAVPR
jgi:hypothetical protein